METVVGRGTGRRSIPPTTRSNARALAPATGRLYRAALRLHASRARDCDHGGGLYRKRQAMIAPVFADTKFNRRDRPLPTPGKIGVSLKSRRLITATHNLLKLFRHQPRPPRPERPAPARLSKSPTTERCTAVADKTGSDTICQQPRLKAVAARRARCLLDDLGSGGVPREIQLRESGQTRKAIQDKAAGDGYVQARALADHRDLYARVGALDEMVWDSLVLVPEQHDGSLPGRLDQCERRGIFGELNRDDAPAGGALPFEPAVLAGLERISALSGNALEWPMAPREAPAATCTRSR